jgi:hypothetical protein
MPDTVFIGNFPKGQVTNREAYFIENEAFPTLFNAYAWRGRARRKRGTASLAQMQRQIEAVAIPSDPWDKPALVLVAGAGNLISTFTLESTSSIAPGTIELVLGANTYTEPATPDGTLGNYQLRNGSHHYCRRRGRLSNRNIWLLSWPSWNGIERFCSQYNELFI